jgi:hypothetical protein
MMRMLPAHTILPNKSQSFSIVWADDTDSICALHCVLTYLDNHASNRHRTNATRPFPMASRSARRASNGATALSSLTSSSSLPQPPLSPRNAPAAASAQSAGILAGMPSRPGDLVDNLTRSGSFAFLSELFDTERLFELRDFRIARVMPKSEAAEQFAASVHLVLDLADKYPRDSLAAQILDCVAQFLPALLSPCTSRGRVRQITVNAKRFRRDEWRGLWETAFGTARN